MKKNKIKIIFLIIILGITIIILNPRKTLAQLITDDITIGEERYTVNFTTSRKNFPKEIEDYYKNEYPEGLEDYSDALLNYKDKNGNDLNLTGEDYENQIEYECFETETCILSTLNDYNQEMFDDFLLRYSSVGNKIELPTKITYKNIEYTLNYYYTTSGEGIELDCGIPTIKLNGTNFERFSYFGWYTNKITPNSNLVDNIEMDWDFYIHNIKLKNIIKGEDVDSNQKNRIVIEQDIYIPDGTYNGINIKDGVIEVSLKNNETIEVPIIGNNYIYPYSLDENEYFVEIDTNEKLPCIGSDIYYDLGEGELTFTHTFTAAKPLIIKNNVINGDPNKEFGFTLNLNDTDMNGTFSGIKFNNGYGRFYLKAGEEKNILLPNNNYSYSISATNYNDYNLNKSYYYGTISSTNSITHEFTYTYNNTLSLDGLYSATVVSPEEMVPGRSYVIFRATGGVGYILTGKGNAKTLTSYGSYSGAKVTWPDNGDAYSNVVWTYNGTKDKALFESFGAVNTYLTVGKSTSGKRPVSNEKSYVKLETTSSPAMKVSNDKYFLQLMSDNKKYTSATSGSSLYFAEIDENIFKVEFSGSNDGLHIYTGTVDKEYAAIAGSTITAPTEENVYKPLKYNYKLDSWIELNTGMIVKPGETLQVNRDYKFYAKWVPKTYDIGVNKNVVGNLDTSSFIKTEVFDYSELYNLYSTSYDNERWSFIEKNNKVYFASDKESHNSTGTVFIDNYTNSKKGLLTSVDNRNKNNASKEKSNGSQYFDGIVTQGLSEMLIENLFDKNSNLHGVNYVGEDNFLYQYDQETGLYYYDSSKNAASYNKSDNRFYVYDYIVGTSKSFKEGENKSDFLPFNYMSKEDVEKNKNFASGNGSVNYWFGLKTDISFNLIEKPGTIEQNGEYSNKDGRGNDMIFKFSGDDDVFVFIDDKLVLDLGGLHDVVYGEINFSSGKITVAQNGAKIDNTKIGGYGYNLSDATDDSKIQQYDLKDISSGTHKLSFYYIERGASRANLALYFNISDVYDKPGNIEIKRDLSSHEPEVEHEFVMTLSDETITGPYGDLTFNKGVSKFGLKGGESVIIRDLPAGITYKLAAKIPNEQKNFFQLNGKQYTTKMIEGRVVGGNTVFLDYANELDLENPKTGNNDGVFCLLAVMLIFTIGIYIFSSKQKMLDL